MRVRDREWPSRVGVQLHRRRLSWHEAQAALGISAAVLFEFTCEGILAPAIEAPLPFDATEVEGVADLLRDAREREKRDGRWACH